MKNNDQILLESLYSKILLKEEENIESNPPDKKTAGERIFDSKGKEIYPTELQDGSACAYDDRQNLIYKRDKWGDDERWEYDDDNALIYHKDESGNEMFKTFTNNSVKYFYKDSDGLESILYMEFWNDIDKLDIDGILKEKYTKNIHGSEVLEKWNKEGQIIYHKQYSELSARIHEKEYKYDKDGNCIYYRLDDDITRFIHHPKEGRLTVYSNNGNRENFSIYDERGIIVREKHIYKSEDIEDNLVYNNSWLKCNWKRRMIFDT